MLEFFSAVATLAINFNVLFLLRLGGFWLGHNVAQLPNSNSHFVPAAKVVLIEKVFLLLLLFNLAVVWLWLIFCAFFFFLVPQRLGTCHTMSG